MLALAVVAAFIALALAAQRWGAESRPGFTDGRTDYKERWFIHSRGD